MRFTTVLGCSLILAGVSAWAEEPVIGLNAVADPATADAVATPAADPLAARQSMPMEQRVSLLEQQLNNLTQMNLPAKMDSLEQQIHQLNGQLEEQAHSLQQLADQQKQYYQDLDSRLANHKAPVATKLPATTADAVKPAKATAAIKPAQPLAAADADDTPTQVTAPANAIANAETALVQNKVAVNSQAATSKVAATGSEEKAYQTAFDLMVKKQNTAAINAFQAFLKAYPNSSMYAPSAHYWLGELYHAANKNTLASKEFTTVIQQYPTHPKVADAMLKLAIIHEDAGLSAQAKQQLQKIIQQFPDSTAAKLAKMRLQGMKSTVAAVSP